MSPGAFPFPAPLTSGATGAARAGIVALPQPACLPGSLSSPSPAPHPARGSEPQQPAASRRDAWRMEGLRSRAEEPQGAANCPRRSVYKPQNILRRVHLYKHGLK